MFCVSEAQAAVIRTAFEQHGELSAVVVELRRLFPGVDNIALARECASASSLAGNRSRPVCRASICHSLPKGKSILLSATERPASDGTDQAGARTPKSRRKIWNAPPGADARLVRWRRSRSTIG
jgi:hypothetical protein